MDKSPEAFLSEHGETHTVSREIDFKKEDPQSFEFLHIKNIVNKINPISDKIYMKLSEVK